MGEETTHPTVLVADDGPVRHLILNRPERHNAFTWQMEAALEEALLTAAGDASVAVVVLRGAGRSFSSGFDLGTLSSADHAQLGDAVADVRETRERVQRYLRLWAIPVPVIAQVHGYCLGMANEVLGVADLVVCGTSAKIGLPEAKDVGLPPTLGMLPHRIGLQRTKELLMTGRLLSGDEAVALGLAIAVHQDEELGGAVAELAATIASSGRDRLAVTKLAANAWLDSFAMERSAMQGASWHALFHQVRGAPT